MLISKFAFGGKVFFKINLSFFIFLGLFFFQGTNVIALENAQKNKLLFPVHGSIKIGWNEERDATVYFTGTIGNCSVNQFQVPVGDGEVIQCESKTDTNNEKIPEKYAIHAGYNTGNFSYYVTFVKLEADPDKLIHALHTDTTYTLDATHPILMNLNINQNQQDVVVTFDAHVGETCSLAKKDYPLHTNTKDLKFICTSKSKAVFGGNLVFEQRNFSARKFLKARKENERLLWKEPNDTLTVKEFFTKTPEPEDFKIGEGYTIRFNYFRYAATGN